MRLYGIILGENDSEPKLSPALTAAEIEVLARFDEHWRVILAADDAMLVRSLAKRGYLDVLKRRVPLFRVSDLGRAMLPC